MKGGSYQVALGGIRQFMTFPKCPSVDKLLVFIGKWQEARMEHGQGLPDAHLREMFINVLPNSVADEVNRRPKGELSTLQSVIDFVTNELSRYRDRALQNAQDGQLADILGISSRTHSIHALQEQDGKDDPDAKPAAPPPIMMVV